MQMTSVLGVGDHQIAYSSSGLDVEETIVFLHGNSRSSAGWSQVLEHDFGSKRLIVLDLPGHGESARAGDPSFIPYPVGDDSDLSRTPTLIVMKSSGMTEIISYS